MRKVDELNALLSGKIKRLNAVQTVFTTVKSVDWEKKTMTAVGVLDDLEFHNVLLGLGELYTRPAVGSKCLIGLINNQPNHSFLIWSEKTEVFRHEVGNATLQMIDNGFKIEAQGQSLKKVLNDFIDEVNKIVVVNGTTINVAAVNAIKQRLNKILI